MMYNRQDNMFEHKIHKALSKKAYNCNTFQQDLHEKAKTPLIACVNCLQKKPNIEEWKAKKPNNFF